MQEVCTEVLVANFVDFLQRASPEIPLYSGYPMVSTHGAMERVHEAQRARAKTTSPSLGDAPKCMPKSL